MAVPGTHYLNFSTLVPITLITAHQLIIFTAFYFAAFLVWQQELILMLIILLYIPEIPDAAIIAHPYAFYIAFCFPDSRRGNNCSSVRVLYHL